MNVVALKKHRHGSDIKEIGDKYEIKSKSVERLYRALGWVTEVPPELNPMPFVGTKEEAKEFSNVKADFKNPLIKTDNKKPKGKYHRKDLRADK